MANRHRQHLLAYFSDGLPHSPTDLDREVLGIAVQGLMSLASWGSVWNNSPYCEELGRLVAEGLVSAYQLKNGEWRYVLSEAS